MPDEDEGGRHGGGRRRSGMAIAVQPWAQRGEVPIGRRVEMSRDWAGGARWKETFFSLFNPSAEKRSNPGTLEQV